VLLSGGHNSTTPFMTSAELYDPATGVFGTTGNLSAGRFLHTATLLDDGRVLLAGGLGSGGFNFDAKVRRESTDPEDLFLGHIGGMDAYARALVIADRIVSDGRLEEFRNARYASFNQSAGQRFEAGELSLSDLRDFAAGAPEPVQESGKQEWVENLLNDYMFA
jgi:xylose isomerase